MPLQPELITKVELWLFFTIIGSGKTSCVCPPKIISNPLTFDAIFLSTSTPLWESKIITDGFSFFLILLSIRSIKKDLKTIVDKGNTKKFDYKNKSKTKMSDSRGRRNARGRSSSEIAKDPSFMKNTSKGKYLRGIHASLLRQGMASGGAVKKPSTKPSAGNKWN